MTRAFAAAPATAATRVMPPAPPPPPPPQRTTRTRVAPIPPEEAPRRRRGWIPVVLWLLALLVIGGVAAAYLLSGGDKVTVPSVQGLTLAQAQDRLTDAGLSGEAVPVESDAEDGTVVSTEPGAGSEVDKGSSVLLRVSSGPGTVPVPDVVGQKLERARQRLEEAGFTVAEPVEQADEADPGTVIAQDPGANRQAEADATVTLTVSTGPDKATVPDVTGGSVDDARAELADANLTVGDLVEQETPAAPEGQVIAQSPSAGEEVDEGTAVTLTVAVAAPEETTVPSVIGLSGGDAQDTLEQAGFIVVSQGAYSDQPEDTVIEQVPAAGTPAAPNSQVRITFSLGPTPPGEGTDTTGDAGTGDSADAGQ
jgi:beta-lactam-binding protein with PASTA domain